MTDAWDGRPENPERDGWHWLRTPDGLSVPYEWSPAGECERGRWPDYWLSAGDDCWRAKDCTYLGPCLTPAEVAERERAARVAALEEAASLIECGCKNRHDVVMQRPNSAARWSLCEHPNCMMIEAAAIRALAKESRDE